MFASTALTSAAPFVSFGTIVSKCIPRSVIQSAVLFPSRIGRPAYTETGYDYVSSLSTAFTASARTGIERDNESRIAHDVDMDIDSSSSDESSLSLLSSSSFGMSTGLKTATLQAIEQDSQHINRSLESVICPSESCSGTGDWLVHSPAAPAAWVVGGLAFALGIWFIFPSYKWQNKVFLGGSVAMASLCLSLFLRAVLVKLSDTGQQGAYKVSLFFNYFSGVLVLHLIVSMVLRLRAHFHPLVGKAHTVITWFPRLLLMACAGLSAASVAVMFSESDIDTTVMGGASTRITQTLLILVMIVSLGMSTLVGKIANYDGAEYFSRHLHIAFSTIGLLLIWAAFMLARTFVALDSPARSSEVMFYLLNVMPLILVVGVMTVLNAPLTYNFQLTSNWKWVS